MLYEWLIETLKHNNRGENEIRTVKVELENHILDKEKLGMCIKNAEPVGSRDRMSKCCGVTWPQ